MQGAIQAPSSRLHLSQALPGPNNHSIRCRSRQQGSPSVLVRCWAGMRQVCFQPGSRDSFLVFRKRGCRLDSQDKKRIAPRTHSSRSSCCFSSVLVRERSPSERRTTLLAKVLWDTISHRFLVGEIVQETGGRVRAVAYCMVVGRQRGWLQFLRSAHFLFF